jgi:hypothetical protein
MYCSETLVKRLIGGGQAVPPVVQTSSLGATPEPAGSAATGRLTGPVATISRLPAAPDPASPPATGQGPIVVPGLPGSPPPVTPTAGVPTSKAPAASTILRSSATALRTDARRAGRHLLQCCRSGANCSAFAVCEGSRRRSMRSGLVPEAGHLDQRGRCREGWTGPPRRRRRVLWRLGRRATSYTPPDARPLTIVIT